MKKVAVALVGAGMVGQEIWRLLYERQFPLESLHIFGRRQREERWDGQKVTIRAVEDARWEQFPIVFFAGTEGEKGASRQWGWEAVQKGAFVVDNGDDFRMDPRVPLVVPEVNGDDLRHHQGFVANPNCSTIQMVMALCPLHRAVPLEEVVVSTYQSVSGSGRAGMEELEDQLRSYPHPPSRPPQVYPQPILSNVIPHISRPLEEYPGYFREEGKMLWETRKILHHDQLRLSATCVRVPVRRGHCEAITARFSQPFPVKEAQKALEHFPGIHLFSEGYPLPQDCVGRDEVLVGRLRQSTLGPDVLELWCVADNLRKGAALNAVQIAEYTLQKRLL